MKMATDEKYTNEIEDCNSRQANTILELKNKLKEYHQRETKYKNILKLHNKTEMDLLKDKTFLFRLLEKCKFSCSIAESNVLERIKKEYED